MNPSPQQQAFYDWIETGSGSAILEAVAGAGKTTALVEGTKRMNGRVWVGVFNKKLGDELKVRLTTDDDPFGVDAGQIHTSTFHAAGFQAIRRAKGKVQVDADKCKGIARAIIAAREGVDQLQNRRMRDAMPVALRLVSLAKNRLLEIDADPEEWLDILDHHDFSLPVGVTQKLVIDFAIQILTESREQSNVVDFDDMIYLPSVENLRVYTYDWVLIDEAQDTNPARRSLAGKMLAPGGRLVAVGDPMQAIYGFTGADNAALDQIRSEYSAITIPLSVTFRCPRAVVEHARSFGATLEAAPGAAEGLVTHCSEDEMRTIIKSWSDKERAQSAILCRVTKHLVRLCYGFLQDGIPARIEGRAIGEGLLERANRWRVEDLEDLSNRVEDWREREVRKAMDKDQDSLAERISDQAAALQILITVTQKDGGHTVMALERTIGRMFEDDVSTRNILTLCTSHRAKGLEWENVFLLGRTQLMPSPWAQQEWMLEQERNLVYVSITRALHQLVEVSLKIE